ncbi:transposase [Rhodococcus sp. IEGM 1409]|uniref:transposase n=1 Tax=Rhodococcus sp. IEGM 1409 TaxID=3047082 RepID=UPI0024B77055|nr:transposase [Rhodococcus sp. IEGM 1409]MDI9899522.1 transposase [Rhodococcus sp. IEGM 1409]
MLVTAPVEIREKYRQLKEKKLFTALAMCRPAAKRGIGGVVPTALKYLAKRHQYLTAQAEDVLVQIRDLVAAANPTLLLAKGVGPSTAAQLLITAGGNPERLRREASFAALCGTAPVPASSGKTVRYRLSRGGDRDANCALHTIALVRIVLVRSLLPTEPTAGKPPDLSGFESVRLRGRSSSISTIHSPLPGLIQRNTFIRRLS